MTKDLHFKIFRSAILKRDYSTERTASRKNTRLIQSQKGQLFFFVSSFLDTRNILWNTVQWDTIRLLRENKLILFFWLDANTLEPIISYHFQVTKSINFRNILIICAKWIRICWIKSKASKYDRCILKDFNRNESTNNHQNHSKFS